LHCFRLHRTQLDMSTIGGPLYHGFNEAHDSSRLTDSQPARAGLETRPTKLAEGKSPLHFPVQKHPLGRAILSPNPMQTKRPLFLKERPSKISGGDGGESNSPSRRALFRVSTSLYGCLFSLRCHPPPDFSGASRCFLGDPYRHRDRSTSTFRRPIPNPSRRGRGGRSCLFRQLGRILFRQLLFLPSVLRVR
jgi:hypothetical protein